MVVPANIRFELYPTRESVKIENKFAAVPLLIPLCKSMKDSYESMKKVSKKLRGSIPLIYSTYFNTIVVNSVLPKCLPI